MWLKFDHKNIINLVIGIYRLKVIQKWNLWYKLYNVYYEKWTRVTMLGMSVEMEFRMLIRFSFATKKWNLKIV